MSKAEAIQKLARDNYISCEVSEESENVVEVLIEWGDWKHDHLRLKWLISKNLDLKNSDENVTEENGSDCYSSIHKFYFQG